VANLSATHETCEGGLLLVSSLGLAFFAGRSREIIKRWWTTALNVSYAEIDAPHGHDAFLMDNRVTTT